MFWYKNRHDSCILKLVFFFSPVVLMPMTWRRPLETISVSIIFILCDVALSITHPSINYPIAKTT